MPRKWTQKYGVNKGDEVDLEEQGNKIILSIGSSIISRQMELNPPHLKNITERYITTCYRDGVNEIKVVCDSEGYANLLEYVRLKVHDQTIGYELVDQDKNSFFIKDLSGGQPTGFDNALRRTLILLTTSSNDILNAIKNRDLDGLRNAYIMDRSINKLTNFCSRYLLTKGIGSHKKTIYYYHFLRSLEALADQYSLMAAEYNNNLKTFNDEIFKGFKEINAMLQEFYELFYKYDKKRLGNLFLKIKGMEPQKLFGIKNTNYVVVFFLSSIHRRIKELIDSLIELNLESE